MRTERPLAVALVLGAALALAEPPAVAEQPPAAEPRPSWLELGLNGEVTLVGLTYGVRPELLFRLGPPGTASRLRLSFGILTGPDQLFIPVSVGYRANYRQHATVQPLFGVGLELQNRLVADADVVRQFGLYLEGGVGFAFAQHFAAGAALGLDVMFLGGPGVGLAPRVFLTWRP
jgi:hypothetical protein